jgi:hypothetical protein
LSNRNGATICASPRLHGIFSNLFTNSNAFASLLVGEAPNRIISHLLINVLGSLFRRKSMADQRLKHVTLQHLRILLAVKERQQVKIFWAARNLADLGEGGAKIRHRDRRQIPFANCVRDFGGMLWPWA